MELASSAQSAGAMASLQAGDFTLDVLVLVPSSREVLHTISHNTKVPN